LRFAKRDRLRFVSHRDFQRAFERALRRAAVPMAYSAGFSPHPKVSYAGAAPTGVASEAEYLEIAVTERLDPERLRVALDASLPPGLDVVEVVEAGPGTLADRLEASIWEATLPGVSPDEARSSASAFLSADRVEVQRLTKNGVRTFDARAAVLALTVEPPDTPKIEFYVSQDWEPSQPVKRRYRSWEGEGYGERRGTSGAASPCAILRMVVRHTTPAVRPDDVLSGLRQVADFAPPTPPAVTRLAQGPLDESTGTVADPLAPDRDAVGAAGTLDPQT
jgi:radical SAM-linked protein